MLAAWSALLATVVFVSLFLDISHPSSRLSEEGFGKRGTLICLPILWEYRFDICIHFLLNFGSILPLWDNWTCRLCFSCSRRVRCRKEWLFGYLCTIFPRHRYIELLPCLWVFFDNFFECFSLFWRLWKYHLFDLGRLRSYSLCLSIISISWEPQVLNSILLFILFLALLIVFLNGAQPSRWAHEILCDLIFDCCLNMLSRFGKAHDFLIKLLDWHAQDLTAFKRDAFDFDGYIVFGQMQEQILDHGVLL